MLAPKDMQAAVAAWNKVRWMRSSFELCCPLTTQCKLGFPPNQHHLKMDTEQSAKTGMGMRLISDFDYVPPSNSADYQTKPLPVVPSQRSIAASTNSKVDTVFKSVIHSIDNRQPGGDWERDVGDVVVLRDNQMGTSQSRYIPPINANCTPTTLPDAILSLQPKQCGQVILRSTGTTSPAASVSSSNSPTSHNSWQKAKQLTGLDVSASGLNQNQIRSLQFLQDNVSPISLSSSIYSQEGLETTISDMDMESSEYSYRCSYMDDDFDELATPLSPPNFGTISKRPISAAPVSPTSTPAALRVSGLRGEKDPVVSSRIGLSPSADDDLWTSSRESSPADVDLYHTTTSEIAKGSALAFSPSPAADQRSTVWANRSGEMLQKTRFNLSSSSSPLPSDSIDLGRNAKSFSDRRLSSRNRVPPPLEQAREAPRPGRYTIPQRTPYPRPSPSLKSAFDEDDSRRRFSILSKVFGGGSNSSKNRDSSGSRGSSVPSSKEDRTPSAVPVVPDLACKIEGPVTTWPESSAPHSTASYGRSASAGPGVLQRTIENARQSVGLKTKAEKRRQGLKGKIKVVGPGELGGVVGAGSRWV